MPTKKQTTIASKEKTITKKSTPTAIRTKSHSDSLQDKDPKTKKINTKSPKLQNLSADRQDTNSPNRQIAKSPTLQSFDHEIVLQWVTTHNLQNIDITLPKNKLITITGVSGSGKSSLAFHTIYKEWQFRYIESLSSYLRQFFQLGSRPEIEYSSWLSPAIAIEQNKHIGNSRSSVGTLTEIDDYLRLLYAKVGAIYSYGSGKRIQTQNIDTIMETIMTSYDGQKIFLLQELHVCDEAKELDTFVKKNRNKVEKEKWFTRYLVAGSNNKEPVEYFYLEAPSIPKDYFPVNIYGIFDRVTVDDVKSWRLKEDIIKILAEVKKFGVRVETTHNEWESKKVNKTAKSPKLQNPNSPSIERFTDKNYDPVNNISYPDFTPRHFSPNRAEWACPCCSGIGEILQVDREKILDPESNYLRAILPWRDSNYGQSILKKLAQKYSMDIGRTWKDLPERFRVVVLDGDEELIRVQSGNKFSSIHYHGLDDILKEQYHKGMLTIDFQAMLSMEPCPDCHGAKLRKESLHVFLTIPTQKISSDMQAYLLTHHHHEKVVDDNDDDQTKINIAEIQHMPLQMLIEILTLYQEHSDQSPILLQRIMHPLLDRAKTINDLWLGYLSLHRQVGTLSGWEIQRLRLTKQLGNKLTGIIYVLDEPTIGLDSREIAKVIHAIKYLQHMGNTIIVVEHNEAFIRASDRVVEIGPWAGDFGGHVIFNGSYDDFIIQDSLTSQYINGTKKVAIEFEHRKSKMSVEIKKAHKYNLKHIDVSIPLGAFTIVTWPSWAGKTTLMYTTLYKFLNEKEKFIQSYIRLALLKQWLTRQEIISAPVMKKEDYLHYENIALQAFYADIGVETIKWYEHIDNTLYIDQTSIGKTPRSCPATFVGLFDDMRTLFAGTNDAKYLWFTSGHFSFNSSKWCCPACDGYGYKKVELQFLPDTYIPCELCKGTRYKPEINNIKRRWKSISEVLNMYIKDAYVFFEDIGHIHEPLSLMMDIGLWYLKLGQPAQMLSGGESQRLKLIKHFLKSYKWHTVYFLDEPTVWLHPEDIQKLLYVIKKFLDKGDTILMIEHDEDLLQFADKVIYLDHGHVRD